jgi:hypothetical protein
MDLETKVEVLSERLSHLNDQLKRFISHLESEQRVTGEISKRVDYLERSALDKRWSFEKLISILAILLSTTSIILGVVLK